MIHVSPCRDAAFVNSVVNDPSVRPYVGDQSLGYLDLSTVIDRPENWCLMGVYGGFLLVWSAPGVREVHTFVTPEGRGQWARAARSEMVEYCRTAGVRMLWTKISPEQPHVARFAREGGMRPTGQILEQMGEPYMIYSMELSKCQ